MPTVSVILPFKNAEKHLERCIQSIQTQTHADWELVAINDGSTDNSRSILKSYALSDSRIRLMDGHQPGIVPALNQAIAAANGQYLARMDSDDVSHATRLEEQVRFLENYPGVGLVATQVRFLGDAKQQEGYARYVDWTNQLTGWDEIRANRFVESPFAHPSVMFRRQLIDSNPGPYRPGEFPEDYELWLRWMEAGVKMAKIKRPLLDWYDPPERLSRNDSRYAPDAFYRLKAHYLASWLKQYTKGKRPIWVWGAGRITRKRVQYLERKGIQLSGYLDIDPRKAGVLAGVPVIPPEQLDLSQQPMIVSYVGKRGARDQIKAFLMDRGLEEEKDFILAA